MYKENKEAVMKKIFAVICIGVIGLSLGFGEVKYVSDRNWSHIISNNLNLLPVESMNINEINISNALRLEERSEILAGGLGLVPGFGVGHLYAGDWGRSVPMLITQIVGFSIIASGGSSSGSYSGPAPVYISDRIGINLLAIGLILLGKAWESQDAYNTAVDYNDQLWIESLEKKVSNLETQLQQSAVKNSKEELNQLRTLKEELIKLKEITNHKKHKKNRVSYGDGSSDGSNDGKELEPEGFPFQL